MMGTMKKYKQSAKSFDKIEEQDGQDQVWKPISIDAHKGLLKLSDPDYKGCRWNARVLWKMGRSTINLDTSLQNSDPVTCTIYVMEN